MSHNPLSSSTQRLVRRAELAKVKEAVTLKERQVTTLNDQLKQTKQAAAQAQAAANGARGRGTGDGSSELESQKRRSHRLQVRLLSPPGQADGGRGLNLIPKG